MGMVTAMGDKTLPTETLCATASSLASAKTAARSLGIGLALRQVLGQEPSWAEATHPAQPCVEGHQEGGQLGGASLAWSVVWERMLPSLMLPTARGSHPDTCVVETVSLLGFDGQAVRRRGSERHWHQEPREGGEELSILRKCWL